MYWILIQVRFNIWIIIIESICFYTESSQNVEEKYIYLYKFGAALVKKILLQVRLKMFLILFLKNL